jgi:hypothetical protein
LCLLPYTTRQVQATEEHYYKIRINFCNWLFQAVYDGVLGPKLAVYDGVLGPKLTVFTDEAWFYLSGYMNDQNNRHCSSTGLRPPF